MEIREFQELIEGMYSERDRERGFAGTFVWLIEELGELASALSEGTLKDKEEEFADVLAWLVTLANIEGVDLTTAIEHKYGAGCPGCGKMECACDDKA